MYLIQNRKLFQRVFPKTIRGISFAKGPIYKTSKEKNSA